MFNHIPVKHIDVVVKTGPTGRFYHINKDKKYPSITTILGATEDTQWLTDWQNMLGPKKAKKESSRCTNRGTAVHKLSEDYLNNIQDYENDHNIENIKLFNQLKFKLNKIDNIKSLEIPLYSDTLCSAGRADCIAEYNNIPSVIDFKTSNKIKIKENIDNYFLQALCYALMYNEMYNDNIKQLVILIAVEKSIMPQIFIKELNKEIICSLLTKIKQYRNKK